MSKLEEDARPLLERLWAIQYPWGLTAFSASQWTTLSAWATKTAWIREHVATGEVNASEESRHQFRTSRRPSELTRVWYARHRGELNFAAFNTKLEVAHRDDHWATARSRTVTISTLVFRGIAALVRTDSGTGVPDMPVDAAIWRPFWPTPRELTWPPPNALSDTAAQRVGRDIHPWVDLPEVPRFHRAGDWLQLRRN